MTIPNLICVARIIATPWICVLVVQGQFQTAFFAFVAAGISDGLDGYIARNFDQKSVLGSYLDPLSDKILINALGVSCAAAGLLPAPLVAVFFLRDAGLILGSYRKARCTTTPTSLASALRSDSPLEIKASPLSKLNTVLQISLISAALAASAFPTLELPLGSLALPLSHLITPLSAVTATTTVASGIQYLVSPGYAGGQSR